MIIFFAFPFVIIVLSIICCATTEQSLDDNDDLISLKSRGPRLKRGYTRADMKSERAKKAKEQSERGGAVATQHTQQPF
jgi:hypothetical protein